MTTVSGLYIYDYTSGSGVNWTNVSGAFDGVSGTNASTSVSGVIVEDKDNYLLTTTNNVSSTATISGIESVKLRIHHYSEEKDTAVWVQPYINSISGGHYQCINKSSLGLSTIDVTYDRAGPTPFDWSSTDLENLHLKLYGGNSNNSSSDININKIEIAVYTDEFVDDFITPSGTVTSGTDELVTDYFDTASGTVQSWWTESYTTSGTGDVYISTTYSGTSTSSGTYVLQSGEGRVTGSVYQPNGIYQEIEGDFDIVCRLRRYNPKQLTTSQGVGIIFELDSNNYVASYCTGNNGINFLRYYQLPEDPWYTQNAKVKVFTDDWCLYHRTRYFRVKRNSNTYQGFFSRDGSTWIFLDQHEFNYVTGSGTAKIWLYANHYTGDPFSAGFDYILDKKLEE